MNIENYGITFSYCGSQNLIRKIPDAPSFFVYVNGELAAKVVLGKTNKWISWYMTGTYHHKRVLHFDCPAGTAQGLLKASAIGLAKRDPDGTKGVLPATMMAFADDFYADM